MSNFDKFSLAEVKAIINTSNSIKEALEKIGYRHTEAGCRKTFFSYCAKNNLLKDLEELKARGSLTRKEKLIKEGIKKKNNYNDIFCENSKVSRKCAKATIIKDKLLEYKCALCGNDGIWNSKELVLQLDHINGIYNDHRLENLRFLCPNCHSQTETFGTKKRKEESLLYKERRETEQERWKQIVKSDIDFSKFGWVKELSELWHIASNKAGKYVKEHYPDFYKEKCFKRVK